MNTPPSASDPSLLDLENVTFEQWRLLIYNKVVHQKNIFIDDFKSKIINDIDGCMKNIQPDTTLECIYKDLTSRISENQFELEYQKFIDGIVGTTFEYFCQLIIKNSMDNIKRTQSVLNSFSLNNINGVTKPCCNEVINLQESSNLTQIQCLPESNNNTTISEKVIQSHLFNYSSQNDILFERENSQNIQIDSAPHCDHKNFQKKNNLFLPVELNISNEINMENNNVDTTHSLVNMEVDEDLNTTQALMSLAMKITNQQENNFKYTDGFEDEKITNVNVVNANNDNQTISSLIQQNGNQNIDSHKHEEEYQISNNSLKLLESLVNIEHSKLEGQPSLIEEEIKQSNIVLKKKRHHKKPKEIHLKIDKSQKSKEKKHKMLNEKNCISKDKKQENLCSENKRKSKKKKHDKEKKSKKNNRISETQNIVDNSVQSNSSSSLEVLRDQNILSNINGSSIYDASKKIETTNIKSLTDTTSSVGILLETQDAKNSSLLKTSIASTSSYDERDVDNLKTTSSSQGSVIKSSDYKKIYEKDRKSLFNPDVITSNSTKDLINVMNIKKEFNPTKEKKLYKKFKTSIIKKKKSVNKIHQTCLKIRITNPQNMKTTLNNTPNFSNQIKPSSITSTVNKFKRLQKTYNSDDKDKTNVYLNKNDSKSTEILLNEVTNTVNNLKIEESSNIDALENQKLKEKDCIKNEESNKDGLEDNIDWIKQLFVKHNIKPIYIVIDPNSIY